MRKPETPSVSTFTVAAWEVVHSHGESKHHAQLPIRHRQAFLQVTNCLFSAQLEGSAVNQGQRWGWNHCDSFNPEGRCQLVACNEEQSTMPRLNDSQEGTNNEALNANPLFSWSCGLNLKSQAV